MILRSTFIFISFLFVFANAGKAQKIRFTDTSNRWYICNTDPFMPPPLKSTKVLRLTDDTVLAGNHYFFISLAGPYGYSWFREDTPAGKIYCRQELDSPELLLYDYNLQPGDSIYSHGASHSWLKVEKVDSIQIGGVYHRVQQFKNGNVMIEGLGSTMGPRFNELHLPDLSDMLCCFDNNGSRPTIVNTTQIFTLDNGSSCALSVNDVAIEAGKVMVVPNPATNQSKLVLPGMIANGRVAIYNATGQLLLSKAINNSDEVYLHNMVAAPGLYFFLVSDEGTGRQYNGKFTFQ